MSEIDMSELDEIVDFVINHYEMFDAYPMEVETSTKVLTWDEYWAVLKAGGYVDLLPSVSMNRK